MKPSTLSPLAKTCLSQLTPQEQEQVLIRPIQAFSLDYDLFTKKYTRARDRNIGILPKEGRMGSFMVLGKDSQAGFFLPTQSMMMKGLLHRGIRHILDMLADCPCEASYAEIFGLLDVWHNLWIHCLDRHTKGLRKTIYARKLGGLDTVNKPFYVEVSIEINQAGCFRVSFTHGRREAILEINSEVVYPMWRMGA